MNIIEITLPAYLVQVHGGSPQECSASLLIGHYPSDPQPVKVILHKTDDQFDEYSLTLDTVRRLAEFLFHLLTKEISAAL